MRQTANALRWAVLLLCALCAACQKAGPIEVGFLGGLTGPVADLGTDGRNGALLAFEQANERGGVGGRRIELLVRDDRQDVATAKTEALGLIDRKVAAVIGPMTSNIALAVVDDFNAAQIPLISPTVTTDKLTGKNDYFLRVVADTSGYASHMAEHVARNLGITRIAAVYELKNKAYAEMWHNNFKERFEQLGGTVFLSLTFSSGPDAGISTIAEKLTAAKPQAVVLIASALDAAMFAQHLKKLAPTMRLVGAEWAATERIVELGGKAVEGMLLPQFFDRYDTSPRYQAFLDAFRKRFGSDPGFPAVSGYDAASVVLASLAAKGENESLKEAILRVGHFEGAQTPVVVNTFGDAARRHIIVELKDGKFLALP